MKALARRVANIRVQTSYGTKLLCAYWDSVCRGDVIDRDMSFHMKISVAKLGYLRSNIPLDRIGTHSNRASGSCAMELAGFDYESIRKMGRWLTLYNALLEYIQ